MSFYAFMEMIEVNRAILIVLLAVSVASSAYAGNGRYLADRHVDRGMACTACHKDGGFELKDVPPYGVCSQCHGDYEAMMAVTGEKYLETTDPHSQHDGDLSCTECHKGHKPGQNYCAGCHDFEFKVP